MIAIVNYGVGNLGSLANMLKKVRAHGLVTSKPEDIAAADKLILPGVGAFDNAMTRLHESRLIPVLADRVAAGTPLLGVCLGMQMLARGSEEGKLAGLGWLDADVVRLRPSGATREGRAHKVPHMGWNEVSPTKGHPLVNDIDPQARFYFVHSYHVTCRNTEDVLAYADYGGQFVAAVARDNIMGVQFHPEKSHRFGMWLLGNFAERC